MEQSGGGQQAVSEVPMKQSTGEETPVDVEGCDNMRAAGWGDSLGVVSFVTDQEWTIVVSDDVTQIWSDAVQATACEKERFSGNSQGVRDSITNEVQRLFASDCRFNPNFKGDFFSWCAIARFAHILCPYPWRIPTAQEFCELDKALFGTTACRSHTTSSDRLIETYINSWGGTFNGAATSQGYLYFSNIRAYYWSSSEYSTEFAYYLSYTSHGNVQSQNTTNSKALGFSLRCIR